MILLFDMVAFSLFTFDKIMRTGITVINNYLFFNSVVFKADTCIHHSHKFITPNQDIIANTLKSIVCSFCPILKLCQAIHGFDMLHNILANNGNPRLTKIAPVIDIAVIIFKYVLFILFYSIGEY